MSEKTNGYLKSNNLDELKKILIYGTVKSPVITKNFLEIMDSTEYFPKKFYEKYLALLEILIDLDFSNVLMNTMINTPDFIGRQEEMYSTIIEMGSKIIEKSLDNEKRDEVIKKLRESSKKIIPEYKIDFFSQKIIMLKSNRFFQIGVKKFILGNYQEAIKMFNKSVGFHRDHYLSFWNLGRLYRIEKNTKFY